MIYFWGIVMGYALPFIAEVTFGTYMFTKGFDKRSNFAQKIIASLCIEIGLSCILSLVYYLIGKSILTNILFYGLLFVVSMLYLLNCFEVSFGAVIDCGIAGYLCQHIVSQIMQPIWYRYGYVDIESVGSPIAIVVIKYFAVETVVVLLVYLAINHIFAKRICFMRGEETNKQIFFLSMLTISVVIVLSSIRDYYVSESEVLTMVSRCFSALSCILLFVIKSGIIQINTMEQERYLLDGLYLKQIEQYEKQRNNIEQINIICHDLKHRISALEEYGSSVPKEKLDELYDLIGIYDTTLRTGNRTLDIILAERSLQCNKMGIRLSSIVDGKKLDVMDEADIYSLFDNAMSNAIRAVSVLPQEDRVISLSVKQVKEMLVIYIENPYKDHIELEGGRLVTSQDKNSIHGYGVKSMENIAEKYDGMLSIDIGNTFRLSIMLPIRKQASVKV